MPWSPSDAVKHTKRASTPAARLLWAKTANRVRKECLAGGGDVSTCDANAVISANRKLSEGLSEDKGPGRGWWGPDKGGTHTGSELSGVPGHVWKRAGQRTGYKIVKAAIRRLSSQAVLPSSENQSWHMPLRQGDKLRGYLVGTDSHASTVLGAWGRPREGSVEIALEEASKKMTLKKLDAKRSLKDMAASMSQEMKDKWKALNGAEFSTDGAPSDEDVLASVVEAYLESLPEKQQEGDMEPQTEQQQQDLAEYGEGRIWRPTYGATSFSALNQARQADEMAQEITALTDDFKSVVDNIMFSVEVTDKATAIRQLAEEFASLIAEETDTGMESGESDDLGESFQEDAGGAILTLVEEGDVPTGARAPLLLDLQIIKPGPGNARDRHYYPADVLRRDANVFAGVDLFVTDHREAERSERTKVGRIKEVVGFTDEGAPIGRAVIYDGDMAEKTRNRAAAGELDTLECSIFAQGRAKSGKVDDQTYNIVEEISSARAVEFVSKAGAGGKALALVENEGGNIMPDGENEQVEPVVGESETQVESEPEALNEAAVTDKPVSTVSADVIATALAEVGLPRGIAAILARGQYGDENELTEAIASAKAEVKALTESGAPFAQNTTPSPTQPPAVPLSESLDNIDRKFGLR